MIVRVKQEREFFDAAEIRYWGPSSEAGMSVERGPILGLLLSVPGSFPGGQGLSAYLSWSTTATVPPRKVSPSTR